MRWSFVPKKNDFTNESILVCVYYGPNGERLISRGAAMASVFDAPLYILSIDRDPIDDLDVTQAAYINKWRELASDLEADEFIFKDNEERPVYQVIADIARQKRVTQIVIGHSPQNKWEQLTKETLVDALVKEIPFVDIHIVSVNRHLRDANCNYENGIRAYLAKEDDHYRLFFNHTKDVAYEGIFFKEIGTDFNNGILKIIKDGAPLQVRVTDDIVDDLTNVEIETDDPTDEEVFQ